VSQTGNMADMLRSLLSAASGEPTSAQSEKNAGGDEEVKSGEDDSAFDFNSFFENIDFDMLMRAGELFARFNSPDRNTELLRALKPHMRDENKEKIDTAIKLIKITALLPFLRESGLFDKIF